MTSSSIIILFITYISLFLIVVDGRPVVWTGLSGNSLWNEPRNWDIGAVPTAGDDVAINLLNTVATVLIGPPPVAVCNSLQVGGTSSFVQTLSVTGPINIGPGGGNLVGLGSITYDAAPTAAFSTVGIFNGGSRFTFKSGTLSGPGAFQFANLTLDDPALKIFNTSVTTGLLYVNPGDGQTGSLNIDNDNTLEVTDTLKTSQSLTITAVTAASVFKAQTLNFAAEASGTLTIRGTATIQKLNVAGGTATLNDNVDVTSGVVESGATLQLIGSPQSGRNFGDISGGGTIQISGGNNSFTTAQVGTVTISGGVFYAVQDLSIVNLLAAAGLIYSSSNSVTISVTNGAFKNIALKDISINVNNADFSQFGSIDGSTLTILEKATTDDVGQLVLANSATLSVEKNAQVSQTNDFKILPSGTGKSLFINNGQWTSSADLSLVVPTKGLGSFSFTEGASLQLTGITFSTGTVTLTSAAFTTVGSQVVINSVLGSGAITTQGEVFEVLGAINAKSFLHQNGITQIDSGTLDALTVQVGTFNITGTTVSVGTFTFFGGSVSAGEGSGTVLLVTNTTITGSNSKTLSNIDVTTDSLQLSCDAAQCQLFTSNATLTTSNS